MRDDDKSFLELDSPMKSVAGGLGVMMGLGAKKAEEREVFAVQANITVEEASPTKSPSKPSPYKFKRKKKGGLEADKTFMSTSQVDPLDDNRSQTGGVKFADDSGKVIDFF